MNGMTRTAGTYLFEVAAGSRFVFATSRGPMLSGLTACGCGYHPPEKAAVLWTTDVRN